MDGSIKPVARKNGLVLQELDAEVLVYDLNTNKAHCLNESAAIIWKNCDGINTIRDLTKEFSNKVNDDFVWLAIDQLNSLNLLEKEVVADFKGQSRREVLKKIGLASVVALPLISSVVAPQNAYAALSCGIAICSAAGGVGCPIACPNCAGAGQLCTV